MHALYLISSCLAGKDAQQVTLTQLARKPKPTEPPRAQQKKQPAQPVQAVGLAATVVTLVPSVYDGDGQQGDFLWEVKEAISSGAHETGNNRTLWVFNDNEQHRLLNNEGGNNAKIRPFNKFGAHSAAPLSAGVTTGSNSVGYSALSAGAKRVIDADILSIQGLLATGQYSSVKYSSDNCGLLGTSLFSIGSDVNRYIVRSLRRAVGAASFNVNHDCFVEGQGHGQLSLYCLMHAVHNALGSDSEPKFSEGEFATRARPRQYSRVG